MTNRSRRPTFTRGMAAAGLTAGATILCIAAPIRADLRTWDGEGGATNSNWNWISTNGNSQTTNWVGKNVRPVNGDSLSFAGTATANNNDFTNLSVVSIDFASGAGAFTLSGNGLTLTSTGNALINNSTATQNVNLPLTMGAAQTFNAANGDLSIGGNVTNAGNTLTIAGSANTAISGNINGLGGLTKIGGGTLTLSGSNGYSGVTQITNGSLNLSTSSNNNIASSSRIRVGSGATLNVSSVTGSGGFALANGQTLAGEGSVTGNLTVTNGSKITGGSGATASDSVGTLTTGATKFNGGGTYEWNIASGTSWDKLQMTSLDVSGLSSSSKFNIVATPATGLGTIPKQSYVIATISSIPSGYTASTLGQLGQLFNLNTTALDTGSNAGTYTLQFNSSGGGVDVSINYTPEPGTAALFALGGVALIGRRNRGMSLGSILGR